MSTLIKLRRDTAANWATEDPVLQLGEPGYDTTNNELRIGDGTSPWSELTPIAGGGSGDIGNLEVTVTNIGIADGAPETVMSFGSSVANVVVDTNTGAPKINIYAQSTDFQEYTQGGGDYTSAQWVTDGGGGAINITGAQSYFDTFMNTVSQYALVTLTINNDVTVPYTGASYGGGSITLYTSTAPDIDPTAVTAIGFNLTFNNGILLDPDEGDMLFRFGDFNVNFTAQRDINITSGDDLRLLGNDIARLAGNAEVTIVSSINSDPNYTWTFNTDGNLTLPGSGVVGNPINTSLDPLNPNVSTMVLTPDANYGFQALVLDPTAPGHIHLRAPSGGGNIDQPAANLFLGGEQSSFEVGASYGDAPNVFVRSGGNTWTFDNTGVLTLPGGSEIDNDGATIEMRAVNNINLEAGDVVNIYTANGDYQWQFGDDGNLTIPADTSINTPIGSNGNIHIHPDGTGIIEIRGNSAGALVKVTGDEVNSFNRIEVDTFGNVNNLGGAFTGTFSRGTPTSPAAVQNQDRLAVFTGKGYDGTVLSQPAAQITVDAVGNWSPSNHGTHISFYTTAQGTTLQQEVVRMGSQGSLTVYYGNVIASNGYVKTNTYTVSSLPSTASTGAGARAMVSDADSRTWGNLAVGGAGNTVPVWSDGSNWYIG